MSRGLGDVYKRQQTEEQRANLKTHREELETQFNNALQEMDHSKVSHSELSALLTRIADRVQQL